MWITGIGQDVRFALRAAARSPGFVAAAVGTLAIAIGANTAVFSIVSGVLLRPLPFAHAEELVELNSFSERGGMGPVFFQDLQEWRQSGRLFAGAAIYVRQSRNLLDVPDPERIPALWCERGLFEVLGVAPLAGRTFRADDREDTIVVNAELCRRRFGGEQACVGRTISLESGRYTVIGVMPESFRFPVTGAAAQMWLPWSMTPGVNRNRRVDNVVARVRRGITVVEAQRQLQDMAAQAARLYPENRGRGARLTPLTQVATGGARAPLLALLAAVGVVLLIACANVSNLLLARAARRRQEMAVRAAIGASRGRLIRQMLTESLLLSTAGGIGGLAIALGAARAMVSAATSQIPRMPETGLDWRVFAFLTAVSTLTGLAFGILPGMAGARVNPHEAMKAGGRGGSAGGGWLRNGLVAAEVALSLVLLVSGGMLLRSFLRLMETPLGMVPDRVLTMKMSMRLQDYSAPGSYGRYLASLEERLKQEPGVQSAGFIQYLPLQNWGWYGFMAIPGRSEGARVELRYSSPGYFQAMGIPLRRGRFLSERDTPDQPRVILINETTARTYFPGEDPIGRETDRGVIVGIVGDVHTSRLDRPAEPEVYYAFAQNTAATSDAGVSLVVRTASAPEAIAASVRKAIQEVNPRQVLFDVRSMERVIADSVSDRRLYVWLMGVFAGIALVMAVCGVYAVISYVVAARTREFGIRVALGADSWRIARLVFGRGSAPVAAGIAIGAAGSVAAARVLGVLGGEPRFDPAIAAGAGLLLALAALAACVAPVRRALAVDVNSALREE